MAGNYYKKRYSVYHKGSELPLIIYASSQECAQVMGVTMPSFYSYVSRTKSGKVTGRWLVYEDEREDDDA